MTIRFDNRVAIVTGAGGGLGRSHALGLAALGAKVVVNDFGAARDGTGGSQDAAQSVVDEIIAAGGEAIANYADVCSVDDTEAMVERAIAEWGRVDILINNAGILRDRSFAKMSMDDFRKVVDVHLMGSANCSKAVWGPMRSQKYGRIVMTTSSSGLFGNFGQSNYAAAKTALIGLMNTLVIEGEKYGIRVNTIGPQLASRMTEDVVDEETLRYFDPEAVTPAALMLCSENSPNRLIICAGAGSFSCVHMYETEGLYLPPEDWTPDAVMAHLDEIDNRQAQQEYVVGPMQFNKYADNARRHRQIDSD